MKVNLRLIGTMRAYLKLIEVDKCMSINGEYPPKQRVKMESIIKQCVAMNDKNKKVEIKEGER